MVLLVGMATKIADPNDNARGAARGCSTQATPSRARPAAQVQTGLARQQSANDVAQLVMPLTSTSLGLCWVLLLFQLRSAGTPTPVARNPRRPKTAHTLERL